MFICFSGEFHKVLASVKWSGSCETALPANSPIPASTQVVLDHIEIDVANNDLLIFCKVTDERWLVDNMVKWKGYTIIAEIGLPGHGVGSYTFRGIGKMSILGKNVSLLILTDTSELGTIYFIV